VPIPISGDVDRTLKRMIEQLQEDWPKTGERPVLILQFGDEGAEPSSASEFERALSLARFLGGESLNHVRTVAFLAGPIRGHAVLPVLACEEMIVYPNAELGDAGAMESFIDGTVRQGYVEMAERRRTIPVPVVLAMLDREVSLYKAQTMDGVRYVLGDELPELEAESAVRSTEQLVPAGELGSFSGTELRLKFGFASHLVRDRLELASVLGLPVGTIDEDPTLGTESKALRVEITGPIRAETVNWVERSIRQEIDGKGANLICLVIDSPGGSATDATRLATYLAGLDSAAVRTVAFVPNEARADAALIALACDQLVIGPEATLGGPARRITRRQLDDLQDPVRAIADRKHRGWSLPMALLDPELTVRKYTREGTGEVRYFCDAELAGQADTEIWQAGEEVATQQGVRGSEAIDLRLARFTAERWEDVRAMYHIQGEPPIVAPGWAHVLVEFLASPRVAGVLLFIGWFALMTEFASPGLGVPGFAAGLCFLLYFWANVLHGTAGWLEVLLFAAGVTCLALEVFVIPGLGIFGIGGVALIVASLILASQTFIIPRNTYEWEQLPGSLLTVAAAGTGAVTALFFMRRILTEAPVFRRVSLPPPEGEGRDRILYQESLVHREHLLGKWGTTTTPLMPSGKVRFGDSVIDVISDGEVIPVGVDVCVAKVTGSEVLVRPLNRATDIGGAT
jgi:membrane-bound ClpP family serine protease